MLVTTTMCCLRFKFDRDICLHVWCDYALLSVSLHGFFFIIVWIFSNFSLFWIVKARPIWTPNGGDRSLRPRLSWPPRALVCVAQPEFVMSPSHYLVDDDLVVPSPITFLRLRPLWRAQARWHSASGRAPSCNVRIATGKSTRGLRYCVFVSFEILTCCLILPMFSFRVA